MNIEKQIEVIFQILMEIDAHFKIWNKLKEHQSQQGSVNKMKKYSEFFLLTTSAHFISYIVGLYKLFETRSDTINIPGLKKALEEEKLNKNITDILDIFLNSTKKIWIKISILRNEAIGHFSKKCNIQKIFQKAGITPNEIENLIREAIKAMNEINYSLYKISNCILSTAEKQLDTLIDEIKL